MATLRLVTELVTLARQVAARQPSPGTQGNVDSTQGNIDATLENIDVAQSDMPENSSHGGITDQSSFHVRSGQANDSSASLGKTTEALPRLGEDGGETTRSEVDDGALTDTVERLLREYLHQIANTETAAET